ncbi:MAG: NmrA family NAD(P)-binding protein [Nocardioides sp.]
MGRPPLIALIGGTGKTGRAVQAALSGVGVEAHALGRAASEDLPAALAGADAVYLIAPNLHPDEPRYVADALAAMRTAGVGRVVYHSVASPYAPAMPHHLGKATAEDLVRRSGLAWTILQPCAYLQNLQAGVMTGALSVPYSLETRFGLVDLDDVARAAAVVLTEPGHDGATYELGGPALVTLAEVAAIATEVLGRPVTATRTDPGAWAGEGLGEREQAWLRAMFGYYDAYGLPTGGRVLAALLGRTPATVADVMTRWQ